MSSTAKTWASAQGWFTVALALCMFAPSGWLCGVASGQMQRVGTSPYPTGGSANTHHEAPGVPQRFAPDNSGSRPIAAPYGAPATDGQRVSHSATDTQPRTNAGVTTTPAKARPPLLLSPRGQGTATRGSKTEGEGGEERRQSSSAKPNMFAIFGSLGIVLGLFFAVAWMMRRGMPGGAKTLPADVVEVLGRTPLAGRQQAHLIRCGNKILLVALTADSATTLTEITDPLEVDRLAGQCREAHPHSSSQAFRQVFQQFAGEKPAGGWFSSLSALGKSKGAVSRHAEEPAEDPNV